MRKKTVNGKKLKFGWIAEASSGNNCCQELQKDHRKWKNPPLPKESLKGSQQLPEIVGRT